jgi:hypothetical protein
MDRPFREFSGHHRPRPVPLGPAAMRAKDKSFRRNIIKAIDDRKSHYREGPRADVPQTLLSIADELIE